MTYNIRVKDSTKRTAPGSKRTVCGSKQTISVKSVWTKCKGPCVYYRMLSIYCWMLSVYYRVLSVYYRVLSVVPLDTVRLLLDTVRLPEEVAAVSDSSESLMTIGSSSVALQTRFLAGCFASSSESEITMGVLSSKISITSMSLGDVSETDRLLSLCGLSAEDRGD